ncbi:MAG: sorbosone dehydrogenase family protein [Bacteroidota bacterium]
MKKTTIVILFNLMSLLPALSQKTENSPVLPPPNATKSSMNFSKVIGWKPDEKPLALPGFTVTKYADNLQFPRWIYVLPNGDVLIAEAKKEEKGLEKVGAKIIGADKTHGESVNKNRIMLFRDTNGDGKPDENYVFLENLNLPFGMLLLNDYIYVANTDALWRFPYKKGDTQLKGTEEKIAEYPAGARHWTKNIIASKDGSKIYIAVGSSSNVAENGIEAEKNRACILEINPDGSDMKVYASGLRNPVGMAWAPGTNTLWTAVNERDELGDDLPPDYLTSLQKNGFYGWPYSYWGKNIDPRIKETEQRPDLVAKAITPDVALGSHTASLGLAFYEAKTFPAKYHNGAFIGQHGSWNRSVLSGYKVVFVPFTNGKPGVPEDFLTGFISDEDKSEVHGRPVGVAVLPDGSLLVADDSANTIWRISYGK